MFARPRLVDNEDGGAAVEFAIVAPPFVAMLFGIIQFGWAMNSANTVHDALVSQARALSFNTTMTSSQLQSAVRNAVGSLADSDVMVTVDRHAVNGVSAAVATATYTSSISIPLLGSYPISFNSSVTVPLPQT